MMLLLLVACVEPSAPPDGGFRVTAVSPADGATDVVEAHVPELRFSGAFDPETCTEETLRLDGVREDGTVAFPVAIALDPLEDGTRVQLRHDDPLPTGWSYVLTVASGDAGCTSVDGETVEPFASGFTVPP